MADKNNLDIYAAMQDGQPIRRYKKTILGKVHVTILNPFNDEPQEVILTGNPDKKSDLPDMLVEIWSNKADIFFRRVNRSHFQAGRLVEIKEVPTPPKSPNDVSDKELEEILGMRFLAFKAKLDAFTDEAPVFRLLNKARELEKSEKLIKHIEEKLSSLQMEPYQKDEEEE